MWALDNLETRPLPASKAPKREADDVAKIFFKHDRTAYIFCMRAPCLKCHQQTEHSVVANYRESGSEEYQFTTDYEVIKCNGCGDVSFQIRSMDEDMWHNNEPETVTYYPSREVGRQSSFTRLFHSPIPKDVLRIYQEVLLAINDKQPLLTAVGLRLLIEAICKDKKCKGKLVKMIDLLVTKGHITAAQAKALHKHRFLGNNAAHDILEAPTAELHTALDIAEHMIRTLYVLEHMAGRITSTVPSEKRAAREQRRQAKAAAAKAAAATPKP